MLKHLKEHVYCRLKPSGVDGIGIFAIRDIPTNTDPFVRFTKEKTERRVDLTDKQLKDAQVSEPVQQLVRDFFFADKEDAESGTLTYPITDLNQISMDYYVNHSKQPNVELRECENHRNCTFDHLYTTRPIKCGEELLLDYELSGCPFKDKIK